MVIKSLGQQGSVLEAVYTIPESICVTGGTVGGGGEAFLPCGVTTALFDEVRPTRFSEGRYRMFVARKAWPSFGLMVNRSWFAPHAGEHSYFCT